MYPKKKQYVTGIAFFGGWGGGVDNTKKDLVLCTPPKKQYVRGIAFGGVDSTKIDMCKSHRSEKRHGVDIITM